MAAVIRYTKTHVVVLCPMGHLIEARELTPDFAGSMLQADLAFRHPGDRFDRLADKCDGAGHEQK